MKKIRFPLLIILCLMCGTLFFLIQRKWLIIHWTLAPIQSNVHVISKDNSIQKVVNLYFWKNEKLRHNDTTILWNLENKNITLKQLVDAWLSTLSDEKILSKKINVESISISASEQEVYISLNQSFSWQEWPIVDKWLTIESLLKTIKDSNLEIKFVNILVNNKPLEDPHLNFIQPWPIEGFKESK